MLFKEYYSVVRKQFTRMHVHGQCVCSISKFWLCDSDCYNCEFHRVGNILSVNYENENEVEDGDTFSLLESIFDAAPRREDTVADKLLLEHLIQRMHELDPDAARIIGTLGDGASNRAIAEDLGRLQPTFIRQMQRYRAELRTIRGR